MWEILDFFQVWKMQKMWKTAQTWEDDICEKYLQALQGVQVDQGNLSVPKKTHVRCWKWAEAQNI